MNTAASRGRTNHRNHRVRSPAARRTLARFSPAPTRPEATNPAANPASPHWGTAKKVKASCAASLRMAFLAPLP